MDSVGQSTQAVPPALRDDDDESVLLLSGQLSFSVRLGRAGRGAARGQPVRPDTTKASLEMEEEDERTSGSDANFAAGKSEEAPNFEMLSPQRCLRIAAPSMASDDLKTWCGKFLRTS